MSVSGILSANKVLSSCSQRSLSPHKKSKSKRMESPENDAPSAHSSRHSISPHKKSKRMDNASKLEADLTDEDSFESDAAAYIHYTVKAEVNRIMSRRGLSNLASQLGPLRDRVVEVEGRLNLHEDVLDQMTDVAGKLQEANHRNESRIEQIMLKLGMLTQSGRNREQRFSKLEEVALSRGGNNNNNKPTDANGHKRPKRRCCSFCGKELSVNYLGTHQKKHCKKAACRNDDLQEETTYL